MVAKENKVRIIAGQWRGRKLDFPTADGLRPTTDPIRETLFSWLQAYLPSANCLDLYAGSGALGFEAASRGAEHVVLVEKDRGSANYLKKNKAVFQAKNIQIKQIAALSYLEMCQKNANALFDVVFLDPPFRDNNLVECVEKLEQSGCLADDAVIYLECERKLDLDFIPANWRERRSKTRGQVKFSLYQREKV
ncbi:MAG TPA: 16S rRNA (guanine(966)-N(2))-methyltransferase RsmD [Cycloclasticus sp.]|jgi:16S rRNA (guanine966-N2)-methyltransferase|nr:16S rRNA (guanine(966)-N(2))-methyltransferase RsmD [Cycloclasticus sp.]HIL94150.1 16S rRNA (guanine(966)-N(2))-methyltransferase RsmD [Cycloclasticus sp.]